MKPNESIRYIVTHHCVEQHETRQTGEGKGREVIIEGKPALKVRYISLLLRCSSYRKLLLGIEQILSSCKELESIRVCMKACYRSWARPVNLF